MQNHDSVENAKKHQKYLGSVENAKKHQKYLGKIVFKCMVITNVLKEYYRILRLAFDCFQIHGLLVNANKCSFASPCYF